MTDSEQRATSTLNQVVADNLIRHRGDTSQTKLAQDMADLIGGSRSRWRVVDLEGKRSGNKPPKAITWPEILAICTSLNIAIYDLVLPDEATDVTIEGGDIVFTRPDDEKTATLSTNIVGRGWIAESVFGVPESYLQKLDGMENRLDRDDLGERLGNIEEMLHSITDDPTFDRFKPKRAPNGTSKEPS